MTFQLSLLKCPDFEIGPTSFSFHCSAELRPTRLHSYFFPITPLGLRGLSPGSTLAWLSSVFFYFSPTWQVKPVFICLFCFTRSRSLPFISAAFPDVIGCCPPPPTVFFLSTSLTFSSSLAGGMRDGLGLESRKVEYKNRKSVLKKRRNRKKKAPSGCHGYGKSGCFVRATCMDM